jgi:hypothetical protein
MPHFEPEERLLEEMMSCLCQSVVVFSLLTDATLLEPEVSETGSGFSAAMFTTECVGLECLQQTLRH